MAQHVVVHKLPGYTDEFKAVVIPGLHKIPTPGSPDRLVTVISTEAGELLAVESRHIFTPEGLRYAQEWATQTHNSVFSVRVPDALAVV